MKKWLMILFAICNIACINAAYTKEQQALCNGIESYLRSQGYSVEVRDDGLKFMNDGDTYFIEIDETESNPMYVRLVRYVKFEDKIKREKVLKNITEYNSKYVIKAICKEKNVLLTGEMFVSNANQFNVAFPDMLTLMKNVYKEIEK